MHPIKYAWALRALIYKPFFKHIGNLSYIGKPCFIEGCKRISVGDKTRIFPGVRMEAIGKGEIFIGNNCAIEQNVHITSSGGCLRIGNGVTIIADTYITNLDHEYRNPQKSILEQGTIDRTTIIEDDCFIGYGTAIQAGTHLGKHCVVGAHSILRGDYPAYSVIVGSPARVIKRYNFETCEWERV